MKWLLCLVIITITWEHDGADKYTVYYRTKALIKFVPLAVVTEKKATVKVDGRRTNWFCVTATQNENESPPSETLEVKRGY